MEIKPNYNLVYVKELEEKKEDVVEGVYVGESAKKQFGQFDKVEIVAIGSCDEKYGHKHSRDVHESYKVGDIVLVNLKDYSEVEKGTYFINVADIKALYANNQ